MKRTITILVCASLLTTMKLQAQQGGYLPCGTDQAVAASFAANPQLKADYERNERALQQQDQAAFLQGYPKQRHASAARSYNPEAQSPPQYIIPVVFHIIHDYGTENISDAQVLDEMRILNNDYRKLNADTSLVVSGFQGIADDMEIEFRLAALDPSGNCTNGIDRVADQQTYIGDDGSKLNYWDRSKYLNVWVVRTISNGAAGYAYLPGTAPSASKDGILILSTYIGSIGTSSPTTSRALTHEIGHFLNLKHCWGNSNTPGVASNCSDDDGVSDTPNTIGWTSCNLSGASCSSPLDNVQNYMEYSYCTCMFTNGQRARTWTALNSGTGSRSSLWSAATATATGINNPQPCAPVADFSPGDVQYVCAGSSVTFKDQSYNAQPTAYSWSFPGGTPNVATDSVVTVQYNTPGTYSVSETVSNAQGSDNFSRTNYVVVLPTAAQFNGWSYYEGLETTTWSSDWTVLNPSGNGWVNSTNTAATGTHCARFDNTTSQAGDVDEFMSPTIDISGMNTPTLTFKLAYAQRTTGDLDRLKIYVSTDCGHTWSQRYSKSGTLLATGGVTTSAFVPTASQWRTETVTFTSSQQQSSNIRVRFEFTSDGGNDIYIDDINIAGATGVMDPQNGVSTFDVYPNPAQDNTMVQFSTDKQEDMTVEVVDLNGKVVKNIFSGQLNEGEHQFPLPTAELSAGIYLVRLVTDDGKYLTRKLVVE